MENYKTRIKILLDNQRIGPELRIQDFDEFVPLINGECDEEINKFLSQEHTLEEFKSIILKYKIIYDKIPLVNDVHVRMEMYDINRQELINSLEMAADNFREKLIQKCVQDYQFQCKTY